MVAVIEAGLHATIIIVHALFKNGLVVIIIIYSTTSDIIFGQVSKRLERGGGVDVKGEERDENGGGRERGREEREREGGKGR